MNVSAENMLEEEVKNSSDIFDDEANSMANEDDRGDSVSEVSSEFALKLVNAVKSMNNDEITHYEMVSLFNSSDELQCLFLFIRALPYNPIAKIYPEEPFLFFKGVPAPQAFDLSEEMAHDIETYMRGQNSDYYAELRLHDLAQPYLDSYESAIRIYNNMVEKSRDAYHANVKLAKSQVFEISAVFVCLFIILITIIGVS